MGKVHFYTDGGEPSEIVREALEEAGVDFVTIYSSGPESEVPALEGNWGTVRGFHNIFRYLLKPTPRARTAWFVL